MWAGFPNLEAVLFSHLLIHSFILGSFTGMLLTLTLCLALVHAQSLQNNICKEVFRSQPEMAPNSGSLQRACECLGMLLNLPEPQFPFFVKRANRLSLAGLLQGPKMMK